MSCLLLCLACLVGAWLCSGCADTQLWSVVEAAGVIPSIRSCPSWARRGDAVYMFGGYDGVQRMNDFFEFRLGTVSRVLLACCPNCYCAAASSQ